MKPRICFLVAYITVGLAVHYPRLASASTDQVEMKNGDRYLGKVVSLNSNALILQSEHLGKVTLARSNVALIRFDGVAANTAPPTAAAQVGPVAPNPQMPASDSAGLAAKLASNSNLIARVQKQFLEGAGGPAQQKFEELVSGLLTGKLNVEDLRAQAKATAEQVRALRKDMDESSSWALDGYLAILDQFVGQTSSAAPPTDSSSAKSKQQDLLEEQ